MLKKPTYEISRRRNGKLLFTTERRKRTFLSCDPPCKLPLLARAKDEALWLDTMTNLSIPVYPTIKMIIMITIIIKVIIMAATRQKIYLIWNVNVPIHIFLKEFLETKDSGIIYVGVLDCTQWFVFNSNSKFSVTILLKCRIWWQLDQVMP